MIGYGIGQRGCIVGVDHRQVKGIKRTLAIFVGCLDVDAQDSDIRILGQTAKGLGRAIKGEPRG